jgi:tetratricopeptide (TPR) repeat protein
MEKISLSIVTVLLLGAININAGVWDTTKEYGNKAMFWKSQHLEDVDFTNIYPKDFYKKSYFGFAITGAAIVGAGAFTYFTAGVGAPAAATGTSAVAAWVAGGGAGSYMAGLSAIGGWFGGNAMLGAAILNGISIGTIGGGTSTFAALSVLGKVGVMASVTAMSLDGVAYFSNSETNKLEYKIKVTIPKDLGSKDTRQLVDRIYENKEEINEALEDGNGSKQKTLFDLQEQYNKDGIRLLEHKISMTDNQEDLIVLGLIAWNNGEYGLFDKAISHINSADLDNTGFLNYLYALQSLANGNSEKVLSYLDNAIDENPYAIEPYILYINVLGNNDFTKHESKIASLVKQASEKFDSDKYATGYSLAGVYYRAATFYFTSKRYVKAKQYYEKAFEELGFLQKHFFGKQLKHTIQLGVANSLFSQNKITSADKVYQEIIADIDEENDNERKNIKDQYLGNKK